VVAAATGGVVGRVLSKGDGPALDLARLRASAAFGWKLYAANVLGLVILRFDLFFLNASAGGRQVGYYAAALAIASLATLGADAVGGVLFPRVAALSSHADSDKLLDTETRALRHATLALVLGAGLSTLILLTLLEPIFGARFVPARVPGLVILPGMAALGLAGAFYASLAGRGRAGYALTAGLTLAPISILLYLVLIPRFGATGAALASTIAYTASATLAGLFLQRESGRPTLRRLVPGRAELDDYLLLLQWVLGRGRFRARSLP
jgi:O-antigen/teichoic acid export membrane protein